MDARNDKFDPTQGYFLNAGLTPFVGFDETDSGARVTLDARGYQGVGAFTDAERPLVLLTCDDGRNYSKPMLSTGYAKGKDADGLAMGSVAGTQGRRQTRGSTASSATRSW